MTGRELLDTVGAAVLPARQLRYATTDQFDDITDDELTIVARNLRAAAYSLNSGALHLDAIVAGRALARMEAQ